MSLTSPSCLMNLENCKNKLESAGVVFEPGLSNLELNAVEVCFKFQFPPDLRDFLQFSLPVNNGFANWRLIDDPKLQGMLDWPFEGLCFDIENNLFWLPQWGDRPSETQAAFAIAREYVNQAPKLIPICAHRYMPAAPHAIGNPVFSVYQTDIVHYGANLENYLHNEFFSYFSKSAFSLPADIRYINFWSELVELNNG